MSAGYMHVNSSPGDAHNSAVSGYNSHEIHDAEQGEELRPNPRKHIMYSSTAYTGIANSPPYEFDPVPKNSKSKKPLRRGGRILKNWWREAVAAILLVGSAVAIFATLYPYQNRPIPQWPLSITINAFISVWMLILRGSAGYLLSQGISHLKWR